MAVTKQDYLPIIIVGLVAVVAIFVFLIIFNNSCLKSEKDMVGYGSFFLSEDYFIDRGLDNNLDLSIGILLDLYNKGKISQAELNYWIEWINSRLQNIPYESPFKGNIEDKKK